jgi:hypothetical protein
VIKESDFSETTDNNDSDEEAHKNAHLLLEKANEIGT